MLVCIDADVLMYCGVLCCVMLTLCTVRTVCCVLDTSKGISDSVDTTRSGAVLHCADIDANETVSVTLNATLEQHTDEAAPGWLVRYSQ